MTTNPLTPHEIHTLREIIREQEQSAARGGREFAGPWLTIKRLLDERENLRDTIRIHREKLEEIGDAECCFVTAMSLNSITCSRVCQVLASDFLEEVPF